MWSKAVLKYYSLQKISDEELDDIIFEHFLYLTEQYEKDKKLIPEGNLIEISYEDLKADSFDLIRNIYSKLDIPDFELTTNDLLKQLEMEREYQNFQFQFSDETLKRINDRWGKYITEWGYGAIDKECTSA